MSFLSVPQGMRTTSLAILYILASTLIAIIRPSAEAALVVGAMGGGVAAIKWGNAKEGQG